MKGPGAENCRARKRIGVWKKYLSEHLCRKMKEIKPVGTPRGGFGNSDRSVKMATRRRRVPRSYARNLCI
jgi:hypothetical protein